MSLLLLLGSLLFLTLYSHQYFLYCSGFHLHITMLFCIILTVFHQFYIQRSFFLSLSLTIVVFQLYFYKIVTRQIIWTWKLRKSKVNESHHQNIDLFFPILFFCSASGVLARCTQIMICRVLYGDGCCMVDSCFMYRLKICIFPQVSIMYNYSLNFHQFEWNFLHSWMCVCVFVCLSILLYMCDGIIFIIDSCSITICDTKIPDEIHKKIRYFLEHRCGYTSIQYSILDLNHTWHCLTLLKM